MNILILTTHLNSGGITSYLLTLSRGLVKDGHQVWIASSGGNMEKDFVAQGVNLKNLNIKTKSELSPKLYFALTPLKQLVKEEHIQIIHAQTRITQVLAYFLKRLTKTPYVTTCHGFFKPKFFRKMFSCWGDGTIAISQAVYDHLVQDFQVSKNKISLIGNGVNVNDFPYVDDRLRQLNRTKWNLNNDPTIGIIARLSDVKGQDILITAMKEVIQKIPKAKVLIVGEGKMDMMLKDLVNTLNLNEHVVFYPVVDKTVEMLSLFDIFVMPSRQEGLGISVMEAQASGLPVIASRVGGIPSLIEDGKTGLLFEPENVHELAAAIVRVIEDKTLAVQLGQQAREFIKANYSAQQMVERTIKFYKQFLNL